MIGNDIIDLNLASIESNWQRKGFLEKVFTKEEQALIFKANDSFKMVWLLWSMKESAYKVNVQQFEKQFFQPRKIQCTLTSNATGIVKIIHNHYFTTSIINNEYIATTATLNNELPELIDNFQFNNTSYKCQHSNCYKNLKLAISDKMKFPINEIFIRKNNLGVPKLFWNDNEEKIALTISHHGNYGGYAMLNC